MIAVDLFAGLGGWTCGAAQAGVRVAWAANHWRTAVDFHAANHPDTTHSCQDLHQADWSRVPAHDILLASPCCQGHSKARGKDRPHHDASRSTAWAVVSCAEFHRPPVAVVENVTDFLDWALYPAWRQAWQALGYSASENVIDVADCGGAQNRVRLFVVLVKGRTPLVLPKPAVEPTPAASFVDFTAGRWSRVLKPGRAEATIARWQAGRAQFGEKFLMPFYGSGSGLTGRSLARPIGTITTVDRWAVVDGSEMRMLTVGEAREAMGFPPSYRLPENKRVAMHLLGNAVCPPAARFVVEQLRRAM